MTGSADATDSPERLPENAGSYAADTDATAAPEASKPPSRKHGALRRVVIFAAILLVVLVVLLVVLQYVMVNFVAQPYLVPSESMEPTLHGCAGCVGERVMADKRVYRSSSPQPGDVVVFEAPPNWSINYKSIRSSNTAVRWVQDALSVIGFVPSDENDIIKRVIAVGGQTVECRQATGLTVDGKPLAEPYLDAATMNADPAIYPCLGNEFGPVKVPDGRLWVMGDNRTHSADSRAHCTNVPADAQMGLLCTGDPMAGTVPVDNVIGKVKKL